MPASLSLPGVPPKAWFKSVTLSFRCVGSMSTSYEFRHDEPCPVYIDQDVEAFKAHADLIECDAAGKAVELDAAGFDPSKMEPRSYRRYAPPGAASITSASFRPALETGNPGSQSATATIEKDDFDRQVEEMEKQRKERLYQRKSGEG